MKLFKILKIAVLVTLFAFAFVAVFMSLWNWLLPDLFNFPEVTFWQAAGIIFLAKMLFGFGGGGKHHHKSGPPPWSRWQRKWKGMPEDERNEWKQKFKDNWCGASKEYKEHSKHKEDV